MKTESVTVFRYDPERDRGPRYEHYPFPFEPGMSVLDVANHIYLQIDGGFTFGYCCKNSHCGMCAVLINGVPGLMCREQAAPGMVLEPLDPRAVIRDLLVDWSGYEECLQGLRLFPDRVAEPADPPETVPAAALDRFRVVSRCVRCYCCLAVCPPHRENPYEFLGPAAMVQLARHAFDPRDELNREVVACSGGLYRCILCGSCAEVCPHNISPEETVELIRKRVEEKRPASRGRSTGSRNRKTRSRRGRRG